MIKRFADLLNLFQSMIKYVKFTVIIFLFSGIKFAIIHFVCIKLNSLSCLLKYNQHTLKEVNDKTNLGKNEHLNMFLPS